MGRSLGIAAIVLLAVLALLPRLFVAWHVPLAAGAVDPNCAPDEMQHVEVVLALSRGHVPTVAETQTAYPAYVPSVYLVQAGTWALGRAVGLDRLELSRVPTVNFAIRGFPLARFGSVLLGVAFVLLVADAASLLAGPWIGLYVGIFLALWPQLAFVSGYVNGDAFTIAVGGFLARALVGWWRRGEGGAGLTAVGLAAGAVLLGKPNGYGLLIPTAVWLLWALAARRAPWRALARTALAAAVVAGPLLAWNSLRNHGDVVGSGALRAFLATHPWLKPAREVPGAMALFPKLLARSSFGVFGNMNVELAGPWYAAAGVLVLAGAVVGVLRLRRAPSPVHRLLSWVVLSAAMQVGLCVYMSWSVDFQPQGRYAMPGIVFLALACVLGPVLGDASRPRAISRAWIAATLSFLLCATVASLLAVLRRSCS